jgi:hypothetical protein
MEAAIVWKERSGLQGLPKKQLW